jgi:hypothetical protein
MLLFVVGGELRELHFPPVINDEEWGELEKLLTLPPKARSELDDYIGFCRELRDDATGKFGNHWFNLLSAVINKERVSKKALDDMIEEPEFFEALAMGLDGQEKIPAKELQLMREWLKSVSAEKQRLVEWYEQAQQRVRHIQKTGQKTGRTALGVFVQALNRCLERHTNKPISTGKWCLPFVVKVCTIAFPDLQDPNREETKVVDHENEQRREELQKDFRAERRVKKAIEEFQDDSESERMSDWQHLVPGWKPATQLVLEGHGIKMYVRKVGDYTKTAFEKSSPEVTEVIFPGDELFVSDEVAARHSNMILPPKWASDLDE